MNPARLILPLLILVALIGAPFGMGRMMDAAHGQMQVHSQHNLMAGMDHSDMVHGKMADHKSDTLHFAMCSASVAMQTTAPAPQLLDFEIERPLMVADNALRGNGLLPLTPPPRA